MLSLHGEQPGAEHACEFCDGRSVSTRYDFGEHRILRCRSCTFMWLDPRPSQAELHEVYGADYYRNRRFFDSGDTIYGYFDCHSEHPAKEFDNRRILDRLTRLLEPPASNGRRFLDVGCGLGYLMNAASHRGFEVEGIDCNLAATEWIAETYGFPAFCGDFMNYRGKACDAVAMMDVVEHLPRPLAALEKARSLTRPGGVFVLSTMDADSLVSRLVGKRLEDFRRTREHLYFFNRATIREALARAGFEVLRIDSHGLTIRMDFLARRVALAYPRAGGVLERLVRRLRLSKRKLHFDPRTKMIVYARRPVEP